MSEELNQVEEVEATKKVKKPKKKIKLPKIDMGKMKDVKSIVTSKTFYMVVIIIVALYVIFFPHTKTTRVNAELTGVFVTQKERYFLHSKVEFETNYVCVPTTVIKSQNISYRLNGDIKAVTVINCDGTSGVINYNSNGSISKSVTTSFVGGSIRVNTQDYTKDGQLTNQKVELSGTVTETVVTYHDTKAQEERVVTTSVFGEKTGETITAYDDKGIMTSDSSKTWFNGTLTFEKSEEYTNGVLSKITYNDADDSITATITCTATGCTLDSLDAPTFSVDYNNTAMDYDFLVDGEASSVKVVFTPINQFNIASVIAEIEGKAQVIIAAQ